MTYTVGENKSLLIYYSEFVIILCVLFLHSFLFLKRIRLKAIVLDNCSMFRNKYRNNVFNDIIPPFLTYAITSTSISSTQKSFSQFTSSHTLTYMLRRVFIRKMSLQMTFEMKTLQNNS